MWFSADPGSIFMLNGTNSIFPHARLAIEPGEAGLWREEREAEGRPVARVDVDDRLSFLSVIRSAVR